MTRMLPPIPTLAAPLAVLLGTVIAGTSATAFEAGPLSCRFTTECYDAEGCEETDYALALVASDDGWILRDQVEDVPAVEIAVDGALVWMGAGGGAVRILSGTAAQSARLSVHSAAGDLMMNYTGVCDAAQPE